MRPDVRLGDLDDEALALLVLHALPGTDVGEVMPTESGGIATWTPQRVRDFVAFHHGRRGGLDGPVGEVSFVVAVDGVASGVVRLQRAGAGSLEVGMWLTRSVRGRGIGGQVLADAAHRAVAFGAHRLIADTSAGNRAAVAALTRIGAGVREPTPKGRVRAEVDLTTRGE